MSAVPKEAPKKHKHPILRWTWRIAAGLIGLVVLLVGGALAFIHTTPGRAFIVKQVNAKLGDTFIGGASIGTIEGSPFSTLIINDVVLNDPTGQPAVKIGRVEVDVGLRPLLDNNVELHRVVASNIDVRMARDANGELLIGKMIKPGPSSGLNIDLANLVLQRAHVALQTADGWVNIDDLEAYGKASLPHEGPIVATVTARALWRERQLPVMIGTSVRTNEGVTSIATLEAFAGGIAVSGADIQIATGGPLPQINANLHIIAPKRAVANLVPSVELPDDIDAVIVTSPDGPRQRVSVVGKLGSQPLTVLASADLAQMRVQATVVADNVDVTHWSKGSVRGTAGAAIVVDAALADGKPVATGVATLWGTALDLPPATAVSVFSYDGKHVMTRTAARNDAARVMLAADVSLGERIMLERSTLVATTSDPRAASGGKAPVRGAFEANFAAHGQLSPVMNLAVVGKANGRRLGIQDMSASALKVAVDATGLPNAPKGRAEVQLDGLVRGDMRLGQLKVTAATTGDSSIVVAVRSRPKFGPWIIDVDARVTPPKPKTETWIVDVERHRVKFGDQAEWKGTTGHFEISPNHYAIENFQTISSLGTVTLSAELAPHHLELDAKVQRAKLGEAHVTLDVDAPRLVTDAAAWMKLDRAAVRAGGIELINLDLAEVAQLIQRPGELSGRVDGVITLSPTEIKGQINAKDVVAVQLRDLGMLNAGLEIKQTAPDELTPTLKGNLGMIGGFFASARITVPTQPFQPANWGAFGLTSLRGAEFGVDEIKLEPGLLDKLGMQSELRGTFKLKGSIGEAMRDAKIRLDVAQLRGDAIQSPIDGVVEAGIDEKGMSAAVTVTAGKMTLVQANGDVPLTMKQVLLDPNALRSAPLTVKATIPQADAKAILAVFGRGEIRAGTIEGTIDVAGTLLAPKVVAKIEGKGLALPPGGGRRPVKTMESITIDGSYDAGLVKASVVGKQKGGSLEMKADMNLTNLAAATATIKATSFDLQPLLVFAPGPAGGARGQLDADLKVTGFDPVKMLVAGKLKLTNARIPIAPQVGTLRRANIEIVISESALKVTADGKLGQGTMKLDGSIAMAGAMPTGGEVKMILRGVQPIGTVEPKIDADVTAKLRRETDKWVADIDVRNGNVDVPSDRGEALKPVGAPTDIVYAGTGNPGKPLDDTAMVKATPKSATIVLNVNLHATHIKSAELRGIVKGKLQISADADAIGITGSIEADRGDLDLFGRRYQVERAIVRFDGTVDPLLDIAIVHDFPDVTTITAVRGRVSKPELVMSSDPGIYSQDQLLGFLLGGEPNGDPQQGSATEVATSAGASFIANKIGGYVKDALPVSIDVIKYSAASGTESANVTVGTWLTRSLFLAYRLHIEARPDENANEANLEYWISRRVLIEATTGDRAVSGIDLLWRKRY